MSGTPPDWLPDLIDTNGIWAEVLEALYDVFTTDFVTGKPRYEGLAVWHDRRKLDGDAHEQGFWHLVTKEDKNSGDRYPDFPRAKRLGWCRATIDNGMPPDVLAFDYEEGSGKIRRYLWLHEWDYLVILEKRLNAGQVIAFILITAFSFENDKSYRKKTQKKYDNRVR